MNKSIPLTQGKQAIVDEGDYEFLNQWKWCATKDRNIYYAVRSVRVDGKYSTLRMHKVLCRGQVDHIDRDGLNNRRSNLREATQSQNQMNCIAQRNSSSQYKGVSWHKWSKSWQVHVLGKYYGRFKSEVEAAKSYNKIAATLFGQFARLNIFTIKLERRT